ncbi:uncharacterized protein LOC128988879 isoform X1 [Macrosteles quadrilineatus]|uniref:uncharacterized protein LOC128988879 isoform X1 n=2 Tax=Macrosteles quadrilineatus TaxID=74068 RepID=UPI0023E1DD33|nr:uncharacterized protein LOC128988879 isoform X1 [Macrosteles quadrilineatus]
MDSPSGSSGFDRSEMHPPVPAPRYKRKLITNEDSKHSPNTENTMEVLPPPRRKRKPQKIDKTFPNKHLETNLKHDYHTLEGVQIISDDKEKSPTAGKMFLETHFDMNNSKDSNIECSNTSEMTDAFREIVDSSILKHFINNRVLDIPLGKEENFSFICDEESTQNISVDPNEENRVNSSLTENSATIVGVFYKPEYTLMNQLDRDNPINHNISGDSDPIVWSSFFNQEKNVPANDSERNFQINKKDSEEDDSGVYFSDTKSPPCKTNDAEIKQKSVNEDDLSSNLPSSKPFTSNDRDTFDNNQSDLGPNMYNQVLDSFEAHTVSAFREEVTGRLSMCGEISKSQAVESWLDNGGYVSKKKVINSNFSDYLRNMLEVEESERSLSPYPLSTVDESSDVSERGAEEDESVTQEACAVPHNLSETHENRNVESSDKYLTSSVDTNVVHIVNSKCTEVTPCKLISKSVMESSKGIESIDTTFSICKLTSENNLNHNYFFKEASLPESVSPSIEHGAVNKLISFFETIHTEDDLAEENVSDCEDTLSETQNSDIIGQIAESHGVNETNSIDLNFNCVVFEGPEEDLRKEKKDEELSILKSIIEENTYENIESNFFSNEASITFKPSSQCKDDENHANHDTSKINYEYLIHQSCEGPKKEPVNGLDKNFELPRMLCENGKKSRMARNLIQVEEISPPIEFSDDKEVSAIFSENETTVENSEVPNLNSSTKDLPDRDETVCPLKRTRIPIVVLTEADTASSPIGSIELHPQDCSSEDNDTRDMAEVSEESSLKEEIHFAADEQWCLEGNESLQNTITVVLEKNWGSIGLKIKGDKDGVVVSDILVGGAADLSGLVFQGDRLVGVNGSVVRSPREAEEKLRHSPDIVHLQLRRPDGNRSLPRRRLEEMGSNVSRHSGKGLTGRRSQSSGNLCNGKSHGVSKFFSPCGGDVAPRDRYKFCGSLPNHLDSNEEAEYRNNNNVKENVVLRLQPLVPKGEALPLDQGYGSERSPEDEVPPDLPPPTTVNQLTCPVHHPAAKPVYPFLHKNSTFTVTLLKTTRGLGLSVTGGVDTEEPWPGLIRIKRLFPHQPAWQSGQLAQGDFLLVVNNTSLVGLTNYEALEVLRTTPAEVVLTVCRPPPELQVLNAPTPADNALAPPPPRRDNAPSTSSSSLQLPLKRMESFGEFELTLKKVNGSLGFTLRKEDESILGHYVRALVREPALSDGRIKPGDKIVAVNGVDMSPMSHEEAVTFLRQCGQEVHLRLYRDAVQTPVQALSPTEHHRTIKPILRKEAQDMLSDLAVKKSMSPNESSGSSTLSREGRTSSPRKRRLTKTPSPDLRGERLDNHLSWSDEVLERISPSSDSDKPRRPDTLNFGAERKPHFQFSAVSKTEENLASLDSLDGSSIGDLGVGPLPSEPVSMPPLLTSTSDTTIGFSYRNPAYRSANPAPSKSKSSLSEDLPENRCSDNDLTTSAGGEEGGDGSKGLLKWKGVVFTPDDGTETATATSPDDSISQITEVDGKENQVLVVELNRGWNSRLGFSLQQSGRDTLISAIHPDSVASRDGRLKVGDQLIMVNDESIEGMSTAEVIDLLRKIRGSICITVWRKPS